MSYYSYSVIAQIFIRKFGYEDRYNSLLEENRLFFTFDLIKEKLSLAYSRTDECLMSEDIISIMDIAMRPAMPICSGLRGY